MQDKNICTCKNIELLIYIIFIPRILRRKNTQTCPNCDKHRLFPEQVVYGRGKELKKKDLFDDKK